MSRVIITTREQQIEAVARAKERARVTADEIASSMLKRIVLHGLDAASVSHYEVYEVDDWFIVGGPRWWCRIEFSNGQKRATLHAPAVTLSQLVVGPSQLPDYRVYVDGNSWSWDIVTGVLHDKLLNNCDVCESVDGLDWYEVGREDGDETWQSLLCASCAEDHRP